MGDVISQCGGFKGNHPFLVGKYLNAAHPEYKYNPTADETAAAKTATEEAYMNTAFLSGLKNARYRALIDELHNAFCIGCDEYPKKLTSAYDLSINWKGDTKGVGVTPNDGVAFTTKSEGAYIHTMYGVKMTISL